MEDKEIEQLKAAAQELEKIKEQNRARARRFLDRRAEAGKRQISAIVHEDVYEEINRRRDRSILADTPLTAGQIIEQALLATKDFVALDGKVDIDAISDMSERYDKCLESSSVNINDNTDNISNPDSDIKKDIEPDSNTFESGSINYDSSLIEHDLINNMDICNNVHTDININGNTNSESKDKIKPTKVNGIIPPEQYPNRQENLPIETELKTLIETEVNIMSIFKNALVSMPVEKSFYTPWVKGIIKQLVNIGNLTNKDIKEALERHRVKTARGLDSWAIGTIGNYVAEIKKPE